MDRLRRIKFNWDHSISQDKDKTDCGDETWLYQLLLFCPRCERGHPFDFDSPYLPDSLIEPVYRDWRCRDCLLRRAGSDGIENVLRDASIGFVMMLLDCAAYLFTVCLICSSYWSWDEHFIQLYSPDSNSVYNHTTATRFAVTSQRHRERRWVKSSYRRYRPLHWPCYDGWARLIQQIFKMEAYRPIPHSIYTLYYPASSIGFIIYTGTIPSHGESTDIDSRVKANGWLSPHLYSFPRSLRNG